MITIRFPPMQKLIDYVFKNCCKLEDFCEADVVDVNVATCVKCHRDSYFRGTPKYECHNFRRVYLIRYLATQVKQTSDLIREHILSDIKSRAKLSAVSFGGGPGVEALALMDQLRTARGSHNITFDNIDHEASWEPIYQDLVQRFAEWVKNIKINSRFFQIDITSDITAGQYDVVFVSWILSEMNNKERSGVLTKARDLARSEGYILITDRLETDLVEKISSLTRQVEGWNLIHHNPKWEKNCGLDFPPDSGIFEPKYNCSTAYWVLKKA